ncbi:MAG: hypothetical protein AAGG75_05810 [Bacteroidota bacterium]
MSRYRFVVFDQLAYLSAMKSPYYSPFQSLNTRQERTLKRVSLPAVVFIMTTMIVIEGQLGAEGIVAFEFAGSLSRAEELMGNWGPIGQIKAAFLIGLDFLFIPAYCTAIGFFCYKLAPHFNNTALKATGYRLSWLIFLAGLLDIIENTGLYQLLAGTKSDFWAKIALWCAIPKFGIVIMGIVYVVAAYGYSRFKNK